MAHSGRDRARADRLRRKKEPTRAEAEWLARYDAASASASRASTRVVVETDADAAAATGPDAAADVSLARAEAAVERERGSRVDAVLDRVLRLMDLLAARHENLDRLMFERLNASERAQLDALAQFRDAFVARARAEARLIESHVEHEAAAAASDPRLDALVEAAMARMLPKGSDPT